MGQEIEVKVSGENTGGYRAILCSQCVFQRNIGGVACCARFPEAAADQKTVLPPCEEERKSRDAIWNGIRRPACYHYARYFIPASEPPKTDKYDWALMVFWCCVLPTAFAVLGTLLVRLWIR